MLFLTWISHARWSLWQSLPVLQRSDTLLQKLQPSRSQWTLQQKVLLPLDSAANGQLGAQSQGQVLDPSTQESIALLYQRTFPHYVNPSSTSQHKRLQSHFPISRIRNRDYRTRANGNHGYYYGSDSCCGFSLRTVLIREGFLWQQK